MARRRIAWPGAGMSSASTVTRTRLGVSSGARRLIWTGAISRRGPPAPGLTTSTTKPSRVITVRSPARIGAATAFERTFPARAPAARKVARIRKDRHAPPAPCPERRAARLARIANPAASPTSSAQDGSVFSSR
jgi:hypothetical protein